MGYSWRGNSSGRIGWLLAICGLVAGPSCALASQWVALDFNLTTNPRSRDTVFVELFDDKPLTTANFLSYVNNELPGVQHENYNGSIMHRLARNFVLQGGGYWANFLAEPAPVSVSLDPNAVIDRDGNPATANPSVVNEYNQSPVRSNTKGTLSMARVGGQPNSATNQWFINLGNNAGLDTVDGGFTVFGKVAGDGMTLIDAYGTLTITNLNPDTNDDGVRDGGPFFNYSAPLDSNNRPTDGIPVLNTPTQSILLILESAKQIDYLGANLTTDVGSGLAFTARDAFIDTGATFTGTGGLAIGPGRTLGMREGVSLNRDLTNHGTLAPGLNLGVIGVQNYLQFADGKLEINLAAATPTGGSYTDTQYDRVVASENAFLAGRLSVSFLNGFNPVAGNKFDVVTATNIIGAFSDFDLPQLSAGLVWNLNRSATAYSLSVVAADFNRNGVVDAADYVVWRNTKGTNVTPYSGADGDGDGDVDDGDYLIWINNFGNVRGTASGTGVGSLSPGEVPEPAGVFLALLGSLILGRIGRRRRQNS
jgi:cyclophilin family peptidyl-prolyl cis-trans isomerase